MSDATAQGVSSVDCFVYFYKCSKLAEWTVIKIQIATTGVGINLIISMYGTIII